MAGRAATRRVLIRPPGPRLFSNSAMSRPACASAVAHDKPAMPAPTMATRGKVCIGFSRPKPANLSKMNPLHPKKLLLTKWTAVQPLAKQKHFIVVKLIEPDPPTLPDSTVEAPVEFVEIESVFSKKTQRIAWRELRDETRWRQGWT